MGFFDELKKKAQEGFELVSKESKMLYDKGKKKIEISAIEKKKNELINEIGRIIYHKFLADSSDVPTEVLDLCSQVKTYEERIEKIENDVKSAEESEYAAEAQKELARKKEKDDEIDSAIKANARHPRT